MPLTREQALKYVDPNLSTDKPDGGGLSPAEQSAQRIVEGVAANDAYWDSRPELEALRAQAEGHGQIVRGEDSPPPTSVESGTGTQLIEGTATDEPEVSTTAAEQEPSATGTGSEPAATPPAPTPDNPVEAVARLRAQIEGLGGTPEV